MAAKLSTPPHTQALNSATFRPPPLDGSLTLPQIYDWHLEHTPNHRLFIFCDENGTERAINWPEAIRAIYNGVRILHREINCEPGKVPIIGILSHADTVTYFTMVMAVMRAGFVAFPISPRNSASATAHLVQSVGVHYILVGQDPSVQALVNEAVRYLKNSCSSPILSPKIVSMPQFNDLFTVDDASLNPPTFPEKGLDDIALYLHSSGTTSYPNSIAFTHRRILEQALVPYFGERDLTNQVLSLHILPMYHGMGIMQCGTAASCGLVVSTFEPKSPAQVPTPDNHFRAAVATKSDIIITVPAFLDAWAQKPEYVAWLATRNAVMYGGGPLNKSTGDYMVSQGVEILVQYGSTEGGVMSQFFPEQSTNTVNWEYFKFSDMITAQMVPCGGNTFEFIITPNKYNHLPVINSKVDGIDAYATADLVEPHSTKAGYWKIIGRIDDQIIHDNGEKTNPVPLETALSQDPHVQSCVMFGRGKSQAGVIIDPKPSFKFDPWDENALTIFRDMIWPTVEKMNLLAPQHSRLFKDMVLVSNPRKPFEYTAKNTPRRQSILNQYSDEIEAIYNAMDGSAHMNVAIPNNWDITSSISFVRSVVDNVLVHKVDNDDDLFQHGCDSLQATRITSSLARVLSDVGETDTRQDENFIYNYPTISQIAAFLTARKCGLNTDEAKNEDKRRMMENMAKMYSASFPAHIPGPDKDGAHSRKRVLLTGSTGGLGTFTLSALVEDNNVEQVHCLNRPSSTASLERQRASLIDKGLATDIAESGKVVFHEGVLDEYQWGLDESVYGMSAWPVNFNWTLASFEKSFIGLRRLIDFALSSPRQLPPSLLYVSSVGIVQNIPSGIGALPEQPIEVKFAIGNGYTESKWVAEQIVAAASLSTSLTTITVRVGQIAGGPNGFWNIKEWFPAIVQSAKFVGCLPQLSKNITWVPIHVVAGGLVEIMQAPRTNTIHLIHPTPASWEVLATTLCAELSVPLVDYQEWYSKLEHTVAGHGHNSDHDCAASRLIHLFKDMSQKTRDSERSSEAFATPPLSTVHAVNLSSALAKAEPISREDVKKWLIYWRSLNFL